MKTNSITMRYIDFNKVWQRHLDLYAQVFICSLKRLSEDSCLTGQEDEDQISVHLWKELKKTCSQWTVERNQEIPVPQAQTPVQDIVRATKKGINALKKPDFTCCRVNTFNGETVGLHIECKKLGKPSDSGWKYNKNYVTRGIVRFDSKEYQYGRDALSGMMIGYIVSMRPKNILHEVNESQCKLLTGYPQLAFDFKSSFVFKTQQKIERQKVAPKEFMLIHLWVELPQSNN